MKIFAFIIFCSLILVNCSYGPEDIPYTYVSKTTKLVAFKHEFRKEYDIDDKTLQKVQFYNNEPIVLRRLLPAGSRVAEGKIVTELGKVMEEIRITKKTAGILEKVGKKDLWVSFEKGSRLKFSVQEAYYEDDFDRYYVLATVLDNKEENMIDEDFADFQEDTKEEEETSTKNVVFFNGNEYEVERRAILLVEQDLFSEMVTKTRDLEGRKLEEELKKDNDEDSEEDNDEERDEE